MEVGVNKAGHDNAILDPDDLGLRLRQRRDFLNRPNFLDVATADGKRLNFRMFRVGGINFAHQNSVNVVTCSL